MELSTLSDSELLEVLMYLKVGELLRCRAVCRRWRSLLLHPCLWRNKKLSVDLQDWQNKRASRSSIVALRVAPCARCICVDFNLNDPTAVVLCDPLVFTNCATFMLRIEGTFVSADALLAARLALVRQASLGRLKAVSLDVQITAKQEAKQERLPALLDALIRIHGLAWIYLNVGHAVHGLLRPAASPVPASLKCLVSRKDARLNPYVNVLLEWHATTLETVVIPHADPSVAPLLAALPRLCILSCPALDDMPALLRCASLKILQFKHESGEVTAGLLAFLRAAVARLDELIVRFGKGSDPAGVSNAVLSLEGTETHPAALQSLTIEAHGVPLRSLAAILHRLPRLTSLDITQGPTADFLGAMDGYVLPKLERLVFWHVDCASQISNSFLGRVGQLQRTHKRLHIFVATRCQENCGVHPENRKGHITVHPLFDHPEGVPCDLSHSVGRWRDTLLWS